LNLQDDSVVQLRQFLWRKEDDKLIVWAEEVSNFIELTEGSFNALKLLQQGKSVNEVSRSLKEEFSESYDVKEFISELVKLGFVSSIDGIPVPLIPAKGKTFPFIETGHVNWVYSKPLLVFYLVLIFFTGLIVISNPTYLPEYSDYFFYDSYLLVLTISILTGLVLVFIHELSHLIAGKAVGIHGYFSLSMRLYFPVVETNLTHLWSIPRRKRYMPFLAGILTDGLIVSLSVILLWFSDHGLLPQVEYLCAFGKFLVLILFYGIMWQFLFFIRTDIYYVISNLLGCRNLYGDSWRLIYNTFSSLLGHERKSLDIPPKELKVVKLYAPFMFVATILTVSLFTLFGIPTLIEIVINSIQMMELGYGVDLTIFIEGLFTSCLVSLQIIGFLFFLTRSLLHFRKGKRSQITRTKS